MSLPIVIDPFCLRQFVPATNSASHIPIPCEPTQFVERINQLFNEIKQNNPTPLVDGYAPFCKHIFVPNWLDDVPAAYVPISDENKHLLVSSYSARTEKELPVLVRNFPKGSVTAPKATYLDIILYSREQIIKENAAMSSQPTMSNGDSSTASLTVPSTHSTADISSSSNWEWGIVSVKPQLVSYETPMTPITMMRNALGVAEGGSGIPLDRDAYMKSVKFWSEHAAIL